MEEKQREYAEQQRAGDERMHPGLYGVSLLSLEWGMLCRDAALDCCDAARGTASDPRSDVAHSTLAVGYAGSGI